ncbi:L,D-transpeptidase family protein [Ferrimonas aestuarii]|uniref:L,D-TPase catalytic domain-containing protein n=1 Tax=Ferrimonas aestuarii TaxID=2569539 RepID=A0A4U1BST0_9GAMM|nr:L,D-transpeptidase family protein [Ferrimonas aestuarii]TKB58430.1 hypothetical protein FCL42_01400 [Ferrimonas aestuarii]
MRIWLAWLLLLPCASLLADAGSSAQNRTTMQWANFLHDLGFLADTYPNTQAIEAASYEFVNARARLRFSPETKATQALNQAISTNSLAAWGVEQIPQYQEFSRLRQALKKEQALAALPLPNLEPLIGLKLGQQHPEVAVLRRWLASQAGQSLPSHLKDRHVWDPALIHSLKAFQTQHELTPSGKLDQPTARLISTPKAKRIEQIRFTLRQWLQLPSQLPEHSIIVNIPQFQLDYYRNQRLHLSLPVIVGKSATPTPRMNSKFRSITINPNWTPPPSIINGELLPAHRKDPYQLQNRGFELVPYQSGEPILDWAIAREQPLNHWFSSHSLKQKPGKNNALGFLKLNLTQSNAIYLHDTPNQYLFRETTRALSHGCVRVKNIESLAQVLLPPSEYKNLALSKDTNLTKMKMINRTIFVYLTYFLARVDVNGDLSMNQDIYQLSEDNLTRDFNSQ